MSIFVACLLVESITQCVKLMLPTVVKENITFIFSMIVGVLICLTYNISVIETGNYAIVGEIITGVIISRGTNYVYDFLKKLKGA